MAPTIIANRYRVDRAVGRGGMGTVWLCTDEVLGRTVAVKQVGHLPGESTPDLARALREARSAAALNHPHVVSIFDAIEDGDQIWLVMEYVPGRTLSEVMNEEGILEPSRAARIGAQIADGLAAAHARGTMHRDVKPGNILVGSDDQAKISDFGIARTIGDSQLTQTGMVTGTPGYFSPQLARGEDPSPADDVWALGATLFTAVEGHPPFPEQSNALATLAAIAANEPPRPVRARGLTEAIVNMMQTDPAARWSMSDVAHNLRELVGLEGATGTHERTKVLHESATPTLIQPVPSPEPDAAAPSTRRGWPLVLLGLAATVIAALVVWTVFLDPDDDSAGAGDKPSDRSSDVTSADPPESSPTDEEGEAPPDDEEGNPAADEDDGEATSISDEHAEAAVRDYYGLLPDDTEAAWDLLAPEFQEEVGSYDSYVGWWSTVEAVSVVEVTGIGENTVEATLTYTMSDGPIQESRQLQLARQGDVIVLVDDGEPYAPQ